MLFPQIFNRRLLDNGKSSQPSPIQLLLLHDLQIEMPHQLRQRDPHLRPRHVSPEATPGSESERLDAGTSVVFELSRSRGGREPAGGQE